MLRLPYRQSTVLKLRINSFILAELAWLYPSHHAERHDYTKKLGGNSLRILRRLTSPLPRHGLAGGFASWMKNEIRRCPLNRIHRKFQLLPWQSAPLSS